ncbi:MAG TPA: 4Fe-4S binding protein [Symbiobacteriaceae bacterium]|nr:4Fe-4S binding protein [Symbiobacteriaceae bacterium]
MAVRITDACITCGACLWECPTEAITAGSRRPEVDEKSCTECFGFFGESQCMVVCPAAAIVLVDEPVGALSERFAERQPGMAPENTWIWRRLGQSA